MDLLSFGWLMLNAFALAAIGIIREKAAKYQRKWLLWFIVLPGGFLAWEAWLFLKGAVPDLLHHWKTVAVFAWLLFTYYLWQRGNDYRDQLTTARFLLDEKEKKKKKRIDSFGLEQ